MSQKHMLSPHPSFICCSVSGTRDPHLVMLCNAIALSEMGEQQKNRCSASPHPIGSDAQVYPTQQRPATSH